MRASPARGGGGRKNVILMGKVGKLCIIWRLYDMHYIRNKWMFKHKQLIILDLHEKREKEAASLTDIYTQCTLNNVLYFNTNKCDSIKFSKRKSTFVYQIS